MYSTRVLRATVSGVDHGRERCSAAANQSADLHNIAGEEIEAVSFEGNVRVCYDLITEHGRENLEERCVEETAWRSQGEWLSDKTSGSISHGTLSGDGTPLPRLSDAIAPSILDRAEHLRWEACFLITKKLHGNTNGHAVI